MYQVDVFIAGGGIAGTLLAVKLNRIGYKCMLVDKKAFAAEQSGHSHGYLHQGYIYIGSGPSIRELTKAVDLWEEFLLYPKKIAPCTSFSVIGFQNPEVTKFATQTWRSADLPIERIKWPYDIDVQTINYSYRTSECSYDFTKVFKNLTAQLTSCDLVLGEVVSLSLNKNCFSHAVINTNSEIRHVKARYAVLACGVGNSKILENTLGRFRAVSLIRTSYMLIFKGKDLPPISLILPENQFYGLFIVSRKIGDETVWLISNYLSFGGMYSSTSTTAKKWLRCTLNSLKTIFPTLLKKNIKFGLYSAPKAEFRRDPEIFPQGIIEDFGLKNVSAIWPTKLTITPLLVEKLQKEIIVDQLNSPNHTKNTPPKWIEQHKLTIINKEHWLYTKMYGIKNLTKTTY